jgi:hypothetical protein
LRRIEIFFTAILGEDDLGVVIRAHIHVESELTKYIASALPEPSELGRMDYSARLRLALACGLPKDLKAPLNAIGTLRNKFAHRIGMALSDTDADNVFHSFNEQFKKATEVIYRAAAASPLPIEQRTPKERLVFYIVVIWTMVFNERTKTRSDVASVGMLPQSK